MEQGDVYWYPFKPPAKRRPVVILTREGALNFLSSVIVVPLTTTIRNIPTEVLLTRDDGLPEVCVANLDTIHTIQKGNLTSFITHLSDEKMRQIYFALQLALGFDKYLDITIP